MISGLDKLKHSATTQSEPMSGERDLEKLLATMSPLMIDEEFVFLTFDNGHYGDHAELEPFATVVEGESLTLLVPKAKADSQQLSYDSTFRGITLRVHSSLEAVGLTAAFATELAKRGISANVLAGYYHDHIFVPSAQVEHAMTALRQLARRAETTVDMERA